MKFTASPVKQLALSHAIPVFQPHTLRLDASAASESQKVRAAITASGADVMIVAAYGLILPPDMLALLPLGCINIHASLLPRWRGAAPIQRAIEAGDTETGISIMQMETGLDTGPVLAKTAIPIQEHDTAASLHDRLANLGGCLICETLARLPLPCHIQDTTGITYAAKITKTETALDWQESATSLSRKIRAFNPAPAAHAMLANERLKIWAARPLTVSLVSSHAAAPGAIMSVGAEGIEVACGNDTACGNLLITELQRPSGKRLTVADLLRGQANIFQVGKRFS